MKIMKQWPVFFLLLAFAIAPLFQGIETDVLALVYILLLIVFVKVFLASYTEFRIPYNSLALCICLFYIWIQHIEKIFSGNTNSYPYHDFV